MDINLKNEKRLFIDIGDNKEISITKDLQGNIRLSIDNGNMLISPKSSNSIEIIIKD